MLVVTATTTASTHALFPWAIQKCTVVPQKKPNKYLLLYSTTTVTEELQ
jgi:hypothetical protein